MDYVIPIAKFEQLLADFRARHPDGKIRLDLPDVKNEEEMDAYIRDMVERCLRKQ